MKYTVSPTLIERMSRFARTLDATAVSLASPSASTERTEYTTTNTVVGGGKQGGTPRDSRMTLLEDVIDFKMALQQGDYDSAVPLYFRLKRKV